MNLTAQQLLEHVNHELKLLEIVLKEEDERNRQQWKKEEEKRKRKEQEALKSQLKEKISRISIFDTDYAELFRWFVTGNLSYEATDFFYQRLDLSEKEDLFHRNHYHGLPFKDRKDLAALFEERMQQAKSPSFFHFFQKANLVKYTTLPETQQEELVEEFKRLAIILGKGYILQYDDMKEAALEALPHILRLIGNDRIVETHSLYFLEYPEGLTIPSHLEAFRTLLKEWYQTHGKAELRLEEKIEEAVQQNEWITVRRWFTRYFYLYEPGFYENIKQTLLRYFQEKVEEAVQEPDAKTRRSLLLDLHNEVIKMKKLD